MQGPTSIILGMFRGVASLCLPMFFMDTISMCWCPPSSILQTLPLWELTYVYQQGFDHPPHAVFLQGDHVMVTWWTFRQRRILEGFLNPERFRPQFHTNIMLCYMHIMFTVEVSCYLSREQLLDQARTAQSGYWKWLPTTNKVGFSFFAQVMILYLT